MDEQGGCSGCLGHRGVQSRGDVELRGARGVARGVVVEAAVGHDLHSRQGHRSLRRLDDADGDLGARDEALQQCHLAVGERTDHRCGQLLARAHDADTQGRPTPCRLDHEWEAESALERSHHAGCAQLAERRVRQGYGLGSGDASTAHQGLGDRLVEGEAAGRRA